MEKGVRTRFAPSPTGPATVGNMRTALFNYLFAKKQGGVFILRIEDTDKERSKPEWETDVIENLQWLGLKYDEGPTRQSDRTEIYKNHLLQLLEQGRAYYCFCSEEEIEAERQYQMSQGLAPKYSGKCQSLTRTQQEENRKKGMPSIIRFIVEQKNITFKDLIRGEVKFDTGLIGDIVVAKDLETPLYNFSVVIDDADMKITHVIRGEDHISNTPKQILIQEAFNLSRPIYAHLPLILAEDRTKLSKRHGDNSVTRFRNEGYLPEAMVNFLVLLGWNPGDEREFFSLSQLEKEFSFEKIQKGGAVFNIKRLDFINGYYIRQKSPKELAALCLPYMPKAETNMLEKVVLLYQQRLKKLSEIAELADFFFSDTLLYPKEFLRWKEYSETETNKALQIGKDIVSKINSKDWTKENLSTVLLAKGEELKDRGYLLWPFRVALTGKQASAGPFEVAEILGKEKTIQRLESAQTLLSS